MNGRTDERMNGTNERMNVFKVTLSQLKLLQGHWTKVSHRYRTFSNFWEFLYPSTYQYICLKIKLTHRKQVHIG